MIKGTCEEIEEEISRFLKAQPAFQGRYLTICPDQERSLPDMKVPYRLYLGCGRGRPPIFIMGCVQLADNDGAVIISHNYKPRSFLLGMIRIVQLLFPNSDAKLQSQLALTFGRSCRQLIADELFGNDDPQSTDEPLNIEALSALTDIGLIRSRIAAARTRT